MAWSRNWLIVVLCLIAGIGLSGIVPATLAQGQKGAPGKEASGKAAPGKAAAEEPETDATGVQLEAIGGLSAVNAQHTYLLIGVLSDAFVKEVYDGKQVRTMMGGVVQQLGTVSEMLEKVQENELSDEDDEYVDTIVEIYGLLQNQARALSKYTETQGEAEGRAFEKARKASLAAISKLLGEKPDAKEAPAEPKEKEEESDADQKQ